MSTLRERTYQQQRVELAARLERHKTIVSLLQASGTRVLDVGCGRGYWLEQMQSWRNTGGLYGFDLDAGRVGEAHERVPCAGVQVADARAIPFPDALFHVVMQFTLFSSIVSAADRQAIAGEMLRILRPGGWVLFYDFFVPNPLNRNTRPVRRREIRDLFPRCRMTIEKCTLLAPLARCLMTISWQAAALLERIPLLRTHYLALIQKPV